MCGIFARVNPVAMTVNADEGRRATNLLAHRGPDAHGEWIAPAGDIYLGFRRLSILDLSDAANQPMRSPDGNLLIFNGEIYNYRDLREELRGRGRQFRTSGDTEVLLAALEEWGEDALGRLEGMFAFLFWDGRRRTALAARDFFGIKPLYFWRPPGGGFAIASEAKAFYAMSDFEPRVNAAAWPEYIRFRSLSGDATLLQDVFQARPGELLRYTPDTDRLERRRYWQPADALDPDGARRDGHALDLLRETFRETVRRHLFSDVPVGAQLSGGVDSTLSLAVAQRDLQFNMKGFHCDVAEQSVNESAVARAMADHLGVEMASVTLDAAKLFTSLEKLTWHMDEPIGHPNAVGVHFVSALARPEVTVLISGEGADEVFAGYPRYSALLQHEALRRTPAAAAVVGALPEMNVKYYRALKKSGAWAMRSACDEIVQGMQFVPPAMVERLLARPDAAQRSEHGRRMLLESVQRADVLTACQIFDLSTYLPALLIRQDKMSMAASIENRVPFVTPTMARLGLNLAPHHRATWRRQKTILKTLLTEYAPRALVYRKKAGFEIPLRVWFRNTEHGRERLAQLASASCPLGDHLDRAAVEQLVRGYNGEPAATETIWVLLTIAVWLDVFLKKERVLAAGVR